jgi:hypothetical protein
VASFEFFTVLLSFVVSLGVATLLLGVARLIQEANRVHFSFAWALWALVIFDLQITFWLKSWGYREGYSLRVETSLPPLALAIVAFIACTLATPPIPDEGPIDLRGFHAKHGRKYQVAYAVFMFLAIVQSILMNDLATDASSLASDVIIQTVLALLAVAAAVFRRQRWVQLAVPSILLVSAVAFYSRLMEQ